MWLVGCRLLGVGILCSCSCPRRSGHDIPLNFQQDKYYSLFCSFLSIYEWKSVIPLKVRVLRKGYRVYFRLYTAFFHKDAEPAGFSTGDRARGSQLKGQIRYGARLVLCAILSSLLYHYQYPSLTSQFL